MYALRRVAVSVRCEGPASVSLFWRASHLQGRQRPQRRHHSTRACAGDPAAACAAEDAEAAAGAAAAAAVHFNHVAAKEPHLHWAVGIGGPSVSWWAAGAPCQSVVAAALR